MPENKRKLTYKQRKAVSALLSAQTNERAAELAGVCESTIRRWLKDDTFQEALTEAIHGTTDKVLRSLAAGREDALSVLYVLMTRGRAESIRLRAAVAWLDQTHKYLDLVSLDERLTALEELNNGRT